MTKKELEIKTDAVIETTRDALQTLVDELNHGQRQKIKKSEKAAAVLERFGVEVSE